MAPVGVICLTCSIGNYIVQGSYDPMRWGL